jgi:serine protease
MGSKTRHDRASHPMLGSSVKALGAIALSALAALVSAPAYAGGSAFSALGSAAGTDASVPTDRLIVKYRGSPAGSVATASVTERTVLHRAATDAALRMGLRMRLLRVGALDTQVMKVERRLSTAEAAQLAREVMAADPTIEYAEPDRIMKPLATPNDTQYGQQWNYFEATGGLNLPAAWDKSTGQGVVVAVIDTGYRPHADLAANIVAGYDFIDDATTANDGGGRDSSALDPGDGSNAGECGQGQPAENSSWHGTHVAGTIAAVTNNGSGVAGVAFGAKVQPVRALGKCGGFTSDIAAGIVWASGGSVPGIPANPTPARVINMSLGGSGACDTTTRDAINSARSRGTVVVVAAGNSNANAANFSPASCAGVIAVAATGRNGGRASYTNFGAVVDVAAPGGDTRTGEANGILSTLNNGTRAPGADAYAYYQGTSMASPHVAGVVALMLSKNAALTPDEVESRLKGSARPFPAACSQCGAGIVDANAAVDAAGGGTTTTPPPGNEREPNDTRSAAQVVAKGTTISGTLASSGDVDVFKVTVAAGATLAASLKPNSASDYDLYLYNSAGSRVAASENGTGATDSASVSNTSGAETFYYVQVRYYAGRTGTTGTYTLSLN